MTSGVYVRTEEHRRNIGKAQKGKTPEERGHKPETCLCCLCKNKRGEQKGKSLEELGHKSYCQCPFCKAKRGEMKGKNHPMYGRAGKDSPRFGKTGEKCPLWKGGKASYWQRLGIRVWEKAHSKKFPENHDLHHRDRNYKNIKPENLFAKTRLEHLKWHAFIDRLFKRLLESYSEKSKNKRR